MVRTLILSLLLQGCTINLYPEAVQIHPRGGVALVSSHVWAPKAKFENRVGTVRANNVTMTDKVIVEQKW